MSADKSDEEIEKIVERKVETFKKDFNKKKAKLEKQNEELKAEVEDLKAKNNPPESSATKISRREFLKKAGLGTAGLATLMSPVSALNIKSESFSVEDSSKKYLDISSGGAVNIRNADLDLNNNSLNGVGELQIPSEEAEAENKIWLDSSNRKLKIKMNGNTFVSDLWHEAPESGEVWYNFETEGNSVASDSWRNQDGNIKGGSNYVTESAVDNLALELDGADGYVDLSDNIGISSSGPFSIAGWVYMLESPDRATMVSCFGSGSSGSSFDIELSCYTGSSTTDNGFGIHTWSGYVATDPDVVETGVWQHFAVTYSGGALDASNIKLYVDGSQKSATRVNSNSNNLSKDNPFEIGYASKNSSNISFHNMIVDDIRAYSKELSGDEVSNLYSNGSIIQ